MRKTPKTLKPIRPNAGVEVAYHKALTSLIDEMDSSLTYWLKANYRKHEEQIAQDSAANDLQSLLNKLTGRWRSKFNEVSRFLADKLVRGTGRHSDAALRKGLKEAGMTVQFRPTGGVKNAMQAAVNENVALIKSIGEQHLNEVNQMVMRAVTRGSSLGELTEGLQHRFGVTKRRAAFIARDQNAKITSVINRQRQIEMGLYEAEWVHSSGGKHPRETHVRAGRSRLRYDVRKGADVDGDGKLIFPGELPNCRCSSRLILPGWNG